MLTLAQTLKSFLKINLVIGFVLIIKTLVLKLSLFLIKLKKDFNSQKDSVVSEEL
jgi:hypothetical protein